MPTYLEPVKGNRDGFEQILNWIGSLKVKGEDVRSLEQDVLELERSVQDINSERLTSVVNKRLLEWLKIVQTSRDRRDSRSGLAFHIVGGEEFNIGGLHRNIQIILTNTLTYTDRFLVFGNYRVNSEPLEALCALIGDLAPHLRLGEIPDFSHYKPISLPYAKETNYVKALEAYTQVSKDIEDYIQAAWQYGTEVAWMEHELLPDYQYQWAVFIRFSGKHHRSTTVSNILWLLSEALESISGVVVEIEDQGVGSIWYKLRIFFKDLLAREETLDTLEKVRDAAIAEADKRIEGVENLRAQSLKIQAEAATIEKQSELIPDGEEAKKIKDLDIKKKELEIREKEADIKKKELENYKATLDLVQQTAYMMKEGMLQAAPVEIQINGQSYLSCQDGQFLPGVEMKAIDEKTLVKPENEELQPE